MIFGDDSDDGDEGDDDDDDDDDDVFFLEDARLLFSVRGGYCLEVPKAIGFRF